MLKGTKRLPAAFYRASNGQEPVRVWLKALSPEDRRTLGEDIRTLEFGWPVGMPLCRSLSHGLWEVRSNLTDAKIGRVIFCMFDGMAILLHGIIKKTQKTPKSDLELALRRKKELNR
jgi:phage-related protein